MFTMQYKRDLAHMALGSSGRDCIMLQRRINLLATHFIAPPTWVTARLPSESFWVLTLCIR
jgi:hypothetical protein